MCTKQVLLNSLFAKGAMDEREWPTQSPELNSIDHFWDELEHVTACQAYSPKVSSWIHQCSWSQIHPATFQNLFSLFVLFVEVGEDHTILVFMFLFKSPLNKNKELYCNCIYFFSWLYIWPYNIQFGCCWIKC